MIKALINGILKIILMLLNIVLTPINLLFTNLFPDMSLSISNFTSFCNTYISGTIGYFISILPPIFRNLLVIWFTFVISYYTIYFTYTAIVKIFGIIQKIKFW